MVGRSACAELLSGLNTLTHVGVTGNLSDAQLLDRFIAGSDETAEVAFEALVARHGPMVLDVCGNVLRDQHNAQDAFQATFLVLASRAGSIRRRDALASWLLAVARRVALRSRADLARRRVYERRAAEAKADRSPQPPEPWSELYEEIDRLPERYRDPVVLCYLEGLSTQTAALRFGCPHGTILSRLSRARERLRGGLTRRGLAPNGLVAAGIAPEKVPTATPPKLLTATVRASMRFTGQPTGAASLLSTTAVALAKGVLHTMMISRLKTVGAAMLACVLTLEGIQSFAPGSAAQAKPRQPAEIVLLSEAHRKDAAGVTTEQITTTLEPANDKLWATIMSRWPVEREGDAMKHVSLYFALVNDSDKAVTSKIKSSKLLINGKAYDKWTTIVSELDSPHASARLMRFDSLRPDEGILFGYNFEEAFAKPGIYRVRWEGEGFQSPEISFRVMPKNERDRDR